MKTTEPTLPKEPTLFSDSLPCRSSFAPIIGAESRPLSRRDALRLGLTATATSLVGVFLAGCGGGSSKNTSNASTRLRLDVLWNPAAGDTSTNGRLAAPRPAQSLRVDFEGATAGSSFTEFINRPDPQDPKKTIEYQSRREIDLSAAISSPLGFRVAEAFLTLTFYAGLNGTNGKISQVKVSGDERFKINIGPGDGYPLDDHNHRISFSLVGKVLSVEIDAGQSVPKFIQKTLTLTAKDNENNPILLVPGTVTLKSANAATIKTDTSGLQIVGVSQTTGAGTVITAELDTGAEKIISKNAVPVIVYPPIEVFINNPLDAAGQGAPLGEGDTRQFTATVKYQGLPDEPLHETSAVTWSVPGNPPTIDPTSGLYTAPFQTGATGSFPVTVTATSVLAPPPATIAKEITFRVYKQLNFSLSSLPVSSTVPSIPLVPVLNSDGSLSHFQIALPASVPNLISQAKLQAISIDGTPVVWSVVEPGGGMVTPSVEVATSSLTPPAKAFATTYTAPTQNGTFTLRVSSQRDPAVKQDIIVNVQAVDVQAIVN